MKSRKNPSGWHAMNEYRIEELDVRTDSKEIYTPSDEQPIYKKFNNREESENVATLLYEDVLDYNVSSIDHKFDGEFKRAIADVPEAIKNRLGEQIIENSDSTGQRDMAIDMIEKDGIPDLFMYKEADASNYQFVEVKMESEAIRTTQEQWIAEFSFLPVKIVRVFREFSPENEGKDSMEELTIEGKDLSESFRISKHQYEKRPTTGKRSSNDGFASLVTLVHYGLLDSTGYDTGVIKSLNRKVLAASLAAIRKEEERQVGQYIQKYDKGELKSELETAFSETFGTNQNPKPLNLRSSIGDVSSDLCAMLDVLNRADPLEATRKNLSGKTK